ncbi:MAG: glycosyl hydrolase family 8, partial [Fibrobacteraceae bacterium]
MTHKKSISLLISIVGVLLLAANAFAVLEIPNTQPKVSATQWNAILDKTWDGIKERNIKPYSIDSGLIHRPKSETPGDAVSEGVGYGMIVALFSNDQATFNTIWEA